jgi:CBS domain-containing protein
MDKPITISRLLTPDQIVIGLKSKTRAEAVGQLLDRLDRAGLIGDRSAVDAMVSEGVDPGEIIPLGEKVVLAHYRSDAVPQLAVAVGTATKPFSFAAPIAPEAVTLILILAPRGAAKRYLKTLAALSEMMSDREFADSLATAGSPEEFLNILSTKDLVLRPELMVRDLMSRTVHTVLPETLLSETLRVMVRHGRRGLPVVSDNGEVLGMVTEQELLQYFLPQILGTAPRDDGAPQPIEDVAVREIMQRSIMFLS